MIYIYISLFLCFLSLIRVFAKFNTRLIEVFFILFLLFFAALRSDSVGADTANYILFFNYSPNILNFDIIYRPELEYGFKVYLAFLKTFTDSVGVFLFISTAICLIPLYIGLKKIAPQYAFLGLLLYYFVFYINYPINVLRQGMVMSIFIYSLPFILERKSYQVLFFGLIAGSLHSTGYLILLIYLYSLLKNKWLIYVSILLVISSLVMYKYSFLQKILFTYIAEEKEATYTEKYGAPTTLFQYLYRVILILFFCVSSYFIKNEKLTKILVLYLVGFIIYIALSADNLIAARFNMMFRILEVVMVSLIFYLSKELKYRLILFLLFLLIFYPFFVVTALQAVNEYKISDFI